MISLCRFECAGCVILSAVDEDQVLLGFWGFIFSKTADFIFFLLFLLGSCYYYVLRQSNYVAS